jgi:hypothetical protein
MKTESFENLLTEIASCETVSGKLASAIVRFAFDVGMYSTVTTDRPVSNTAPDDAQAGLTTERRVVRSGRKMTAEHKARLADGRRRSLENRRAGHNEPFPVESGIDVSSVAAGTTSENGDGDHPENSTLGDEAGNEPSEVVDRRDD